MSRSLPALRKEVFVPDILDVHEDDSWSPSTLDLLYAIVVLLILVALAGRGVKP